MEAMEMKGGGSWLSFLVALEVFFVGFCCRPLKAG